MAHQPLRRLLDASAAPMVPAAEAALRAALETGWADPRRLYLEGRRARALLDDSRAVLADALGALPAQVSFLPSGPEALRAGLTGLLYAGRRRGDKAVLSAVEHSALLLTARAQGPSASLEVPVDSLGRVSLAEWREAIEHEGVVAGALQRANAEVGTTQPIDEALEVCRAAGRPLLIDLTASLGRLEVPADWDVLAADARSFGGPPGVGILAVRDGVRWALPGPRSEFESGRATAEPVIPLVVAAAAAWESVAASRSEDATDSFRLIDVIRQAAAGIENVDVLGDAVDRLPHVVTLSALYLSGEAVVGELDRRGFAVSSGSMCTASTLEPSHVLAAMGAVTHGNIRVTLPLLSTNSHRSVDVDQFVSEVPIVIGKLRDELEL